MNIEDARQKTDDELKSALEELKKEQFNLRFQAVGGQQVNTARMKLIRKEVARIRTVQTERRGQAVAS